MSSFSGVTSLLAEASAEAPQAASGSFTYMWLLIALPLLGATILLIAGKRTNAWGHWLAILMSAGAFVVACIVFTAMLAQPDDSRVFVQHLFDWVQVGSFKAPVDLRLDQLSMTFVLLITGVGTLIHIYSVGYMAHDPARRRFFAYLNLFVASMLLLVLADNYLVLYVGWEGVGLASYLLIGFWFFKESAAVASKKAFVAGLQRLIPEVRSEDVVAAGAGVRAQAVEPSGALVDDFRIEEAKNMIHVLNAPSPAATTAMAP